MGPQESLDHLELVDVQVAQRVGTFLGLGALLATLDATFELAAVDQAGQQVMAGVIGQLAVELTAFADVVENKDGAADVAVTPSRMGAAVLST